MKKEKYDIVCESDYRGFGYFWVGIYDALFIAFAYLTFIDRRIAGDPWIFVSAFAIIEIVLFIIGYGHRVIYNGKEITRKCFWKKELTRPIEDIVKVHKTKRLNYVIEFVDGSKILILYDYSNLDSLIEDLERKIPNKEVWGTAQDKKLIEFNEWVDNKWSNATKHLLIIVIASVIGWSFFSLVTDIMVFDEIRIMPNLIFIAIICWPAFPLLYISMINKNFIKRIEFSPQGLNLLYLQRSRYISWQDVKFVNRRQRSIYPHITLETGEK
jgi:hypothetical protein